MFCIMTIILIMLSSDHDPCGHQEPCLHGGNCTNVGSNKYHCSCPASYVGDNCQRNLSECTVGSCMNEGNCEVSMPFLGYLNAQG